ncbi:hypothetical protein BKA70DRAFT_1222299 [Coprinopsis sp. MPI-PUGE-AT-0042]|nr:hypothetical protein BKA70DRAFT_1233665 [Coprinopsis sp. MPI-PUGE-AT-0042]KAH6908692.1 hypothetical protein BKA70DRAFT_1222299 [Coprinopsis sp. MPI-PUGE-AT-0042]
MPPSVTQTGNTHTELTNPASSSPGSNTASDGFVELDSHRGTGPPTHSSGQGHSSDGGRADVSEGMQSNDVGEAEGNDDEDDGDDEDEDEDEGEDEDEDDDAEVGSSEGESGESEDEWDRLSDDEIVANDDMYHDW